MASDAPFFSVVIPTYNRAALLSETIERALGQTFTDFELLVVDDGSTDGTPQLIAGIQDERVRYLPKANAERAVARNYGLARARGRYVTFFDSDDGMLPRHLQTAHDLLQLNDFPPVGAVNYEHRFFDAEGREVRRQPNPAFPPDLRQRLLYGSVNHIGGTFVRTDVARANLFDEARELLIAEDWDFLLRLGAQYDVVFTNERTYFIRNHTGRSTRQDDLAQLTRRMEYIARKMETWPPFREGYGNQVHRVWAGARMYIALHHALAGRRGTALRYWLRAIAHDPAVLRQRFSFGTLKRLLIPYRP